MPAALPELPRGRAPLAAPIEPLAPRGLRSSPGTDDGAAGAGASARDRGTSAARSRGARTLQPGEGTGGGREDIEGSQAGPRGLGGHACPPRVSLTPRRPWAARPGRAGGGGRCEEEDGRTDGRLGGGGGVPLAPPSLLSGLITSVISKPGPGCECGARGGSAGRGVGRCPSVCPSHRCLSASLPRTCRGSGGSAGGRGGGSPVPSRCQPVVGSLRPPGGQFTPFPVNPPQTRHKTTRAVLEAGTDRDEPPPWRFLQEHLLGKLLWGGFGSRKHPLAPGKPHFHSETPSGPDALSPGAEEDLQQNQGSAGLSLTDTPAPVVPRQSHRCLLPAPWGSRALPLSPSLPLQTLNCLRVFTPGLLSQPL